MAKTYDLLELAQTNATYKKLGSEVKFKFFREEFLLDCQHWNKYFSLINKHTYTWKEFKYVDIKKPNDLDTLIKGNNIGVYIFTVRAENLFLDMPKYVFYIGISGEGGSNRPLRERLKDYYKISQIKKRKRVHRMITMYMDNAHVSYSLMKITHKNIFNGI